MAPRALFAAAERVLGAAPSKHSSAGERAAEEGLSQRGWMKASKSEQVRNQRLMLDRVVSCLDQAACHRSVPCDAGCIFVYMCNKEPEVLVCLCVSGASCACACQAQVLSCGIQGGEVRLAS